MAWNFGDIVKLCVKRADESYWGGRLEMKVDDDNESHWDTADIVVAWFPIGLSLVVLLLLILLTN